MCKVIAIANQKGGVAKTTSAVSLGVGIVNKGNKVLIIDCDPQGSCTVALGYQEPDRLDFTLTTIAERILNEEDYGVDEGILHNEEGVDLLPANIELAGVEVSLTNQPGSEMFIKEYISEVGDNYDFVIIDCSPNLGRLTISALCAADYVIVPVQAAFLPVKGLEALLKTIGRVKKRLNTKLEILGILITMVNSQTVFGKEITDLINLVYGSHIRIFENQIPRTVRVEECSADGVSIYKHAGKCSAAKAYEALTEEVLEYV